MSLILFAALLFPTQTPAKEPFADQWKRAVEIKPEPIKRDDKGVEIVTIRMKIKPNFFVYATPQPDEDLRSAEMKLTVKSKDPKTRVEVVYPKGREQQEGNLKWSIYEGDTVIIAVVNRAKGDDSPLECTLNFRPMNNAY